MMSSQTERLEGKLLHTAPLDPRISNYYSKRHSQFSLENTYNFCIHIQLTTLLL